MDIDNLVKGFFACWIGVIIEIYVFPTSWKVAWLGFAACICTSIATIRKHYGESRTGNEECIAFVLLTIFFALIVLRRAIRLTTFHFHGLSS